MKIRINLLPSEQRPPRWHYGRLLLLPVVLMLLVIAGVYGYGEYRYWELEQQLDAVRSRYESLAASEQQYLAGVFQRLLRDDPELRKKAYAVQADVWLNAEGQVTRVELAKSSGDAETDAQVLAALRMPHATQRVPASVTLPVRLSLKGRRPE